MKRTKIMVCVLLALVLAFCTMPTEQVNAKTFWKAQDGEEKLYSNAMLEDSFANNRVLVVLTHKASLRFKEYVAKDFNNVACINVRNDTSYIGEVMKSKYEKLLQGKTELAQAERKADIETYRQLLCIEIASPSKQAVLNAIKTLEEMPDILYAGPDYTFTICSNPTLTPNDYSPTNQWAVANIDLPEAWYINYNASSIIVGVLDSGIDGEHPDLDDNIDTNLHRDFTSGSTVYMSSPTDANGHGTMVAGIIGAEGNNGIGITGAC